MFAIKQCKAILEKDVVFGLKRKFIKFLYLFLLFAFAFCRYDWCFERVHFVFDLIWGIHHLRNVASQFHCARPKSPDLTMQGVCNVIADCYGLRDV